MHTIKGFDDWLKKLSFYHLVNFVFTEIQSEVYDRLLGMYNRFQEDNIDYINSSYDDLLVLRDLTARMHNRLTNIIKIKEYYEKNKKKDREAINEWIRLMIEEEAKLNEDYKK